MTAAELKTKVPIEELVRHYGGHLNGKGKCRCLLASNHRNGDADPSMTVKDGRVRCWSQQCFGEKGADIFELVGTMEHLADFPEQMRRVMEIAQLTNESSPQIVAIYDYCDEQGALLHQTLRYAPKAFRQRRPDGQGGWIWNLDDIRLVLFNLLRLRAATHVVIFEGEQDCETADAWGWPSADWAPTTNPMGAMKWHDSYTTALTGKQQVIIIPDADGAGEKHLATVAASCAALGVPLWVGRFPDGVKDLTAWKDAGATQQDFWNLLASVQRCEPPKGDQAQADTLGVDLADFLVQEHPPMVQLIEGVLTNQGGGWLSGEEKLYKTMYALHEGLCLATGQPVGGRFAVPTRVRVLFIEEEDPPRRTLNRLRQLLRGQGFDPDDPAVRKELAGWFRISVWHGFTLDDPKQMEALDRTLKSFRPTVVYLDVLRKLTIRDLHKSDLTAAMLQSLDDLRRKYGTIFRVVAHNRKIQGSFRAGRGSQEIAGSYQLAAWGENSLFFEPIGKKMGRVKLVLQSKDLPPGLEFGLRVESQGPAHEPTVLRIHAEDLTKASPGHDRKEQVYVATASLPINNEPVKQGRPGITIEQLAVAVKCSDKTVRKAMDDLLAEGRCVEVGRGSKQKIHYGVKA